MRLIQFLSRKRPANNRTYVIATVLNVALK